jgi:hypothetical protein
MRATELAVVVEQVADEVERRLWRTLSLEERLNRLEAHSRLVPPPLRPPTPILRLISDETPDA